MHKHSIAIHGGAGTLVKGMMTPEKEEEYENALKFALEAGHTVLESGGNAIDAVEASVRELENSPLFNAGRGSVFTANETHEMDASIMDGRTLDAGAVSLITGIKNPISLAKDVMNKSEHVFLAGEGAMTFAKELMHPLEEASYFYDDLRHSQWQEIKGTEIFNWIMLL